MSHVPGTDRYAQPDFDFDRRLLEALAEGRGRETAALTGEELDKAGNVEIRTWITLLGALGAVGRGRGAASEGPAEIVCYERSWHHGNAVVWWRVE
jgi:2,3-dihydroxyphenylpropionate 1,2-dioxygenase